jgi:hypothetical protein
MTFARALIILLLVLSCVMSSVMTREALAHSHAVSDERWAVCPVEAMPVFEVENIYVDAQSQPIPANGAFPSSKAEPSKPGTTYEYINGDRLPRDRTSSTIVLDDARVVVGGIYLGTAVGDMPQLSFSELTSVVDFLTLWTNCSKEPVPQQIAGLVTAFGLKWIFSPGDPFSVQTTPLSVVRTNNVAHAKGALPFVVQDARQLSDGRIMLVIAEGSAVSSNGTLLLPELAGSIWILDMTEDGWRLDAIFGGVRLRGTEGIRIQQ